MKVPSPRKLLLSLLGLALLAVPAQATWSIVCVNVKTREVGVATATCIANFNIRRFVPVIFVGEGAAAAQSFADQFGTNRRRIYFNFRDMEDTPEQILELLDAGDSGHQTRQYGIVNFTGDPVTFTGTQAGHGRGGVTGQVGDYVYAIQGNLLVSPLVVEVAEDAFRATKGDMGQKIMAAMEAARAIGGDGRCSCSGTAPQSCGAPPASFAKSAHAGTVLVARVGDTNGGCNANFGCARGDYYLALNVASAGGDPDPVFTLQERYDNWRRQRVNRADAVYSSFKGPLPMPADGVTSGTVSVVLKDINDEGITDDGARFVIEPVEGTTATTSIGHVTSHGRGFYTFEVTAGATPAVDRYTITVLDGPVRARLQPELVIETVAPGGLFMAEDRLSASTGGPLSFVVNDPERPGASYWIVGAVQDPNRFLHRIGQPATIEPLMLPGLTPFFPSPAGLLSSAGRAEASIDVPAEALLGMAGAELLWTAAVLAPEANGGVHLTDPVLVRVTR